MTYRVELDSSLCVSAGKCVASAPGFFVFDDDELAMVAPGGPRPDDAALLRIARACPSEAIALFDGDAEIEL